jgi:peroxiredoxin Q/BCP
MTSLPKVGSKAPDFTLADQNGKEHALSSYIGQWVLMYFYPKDDTPGCTKEACAIRDAFPNFTTGNVTVLGISADSVKSHKKFEEKYALPFILLADEGAKIARTFGVWGLKKFMGREYEGINRMSFLISPDGTIAKIYEKVKPETHAAEVLADREALNV